MRIDYVLPSKNNVNAVCGGVFWPTSTDETYRLVGSGHSVVSSDNEHKCRDIIKKYECPSCKLKFVAPIKTFSSKAGVLGCKAAEAAMIALYRPIFNDQHNWDPGMEGKRKDWKKNCENCE